MPIVQSTAFGPTNPITGGANPQFNYQNVLSADVQAQNATQLELERLRQQAEAQRQNTQLQGDIYSADRNANTQLQLGQLNADTSRRSQDFSLAGILRGHDVTEAGDRLRSEDTRRGQDVNERVATRGQDLSFQEAMLPINWQRERFNTILPMFTGVVRNFGPFGGGSQQGVPAGTEMYRALGGGGGPGDPTAGLPGVTMGGVYSPQQTQEQINASQARNAAMAESQRRRIAESAGSRGMAGNSPLLQALQAGTGVAQMGADAEARRETQLAHAKANAEQRLGAETLRGQLWGERERQVTARQNTAAQQQSALLMALAGML